MISIAFRWENAWALDFMEFVEDKSRHIVNSKQKKEDFRAVMGIVIILRFANATHISAISKQKHLSQLTSCTQISSSTHIDDCTYMYQFLCQNLLYPAMQLCKPAQNVFGLDKWSLSAIQSFNRGIDEGYWCHTKFADWQGTMKKEKNRCTACTVCLQTGQWSQWKTEKTRDSGNWPITRCFLKTIKIGLILEHQLKLDHRPTFTGCAISVDSYVLAFPI